MSNILYNNQHKLNQKPIYDPTAFKKMLETADENLIGFFDELYIGTRAPNESISTNKLELVACTLFGIYVNTTSIKYL
ncbi:hypothetical protein RhiirC2_776482 [Rhizophagus irregularis]|uniref:Uncharacterized protein n=1 Tax=Rhizophagus irregularis TaxID=588596 RepID=A0A2N1NGU9_9GLOM|nr:hypothetical protein RhiirC2_776482 [Rhizophagus irregularis]